MNYHDEALKYHTTGRPGKIEVNTTKPCITQKDLSLAYTPGVAVPCLEIKENVDDVFKYTARGNLVAVVSNGTAVLGLGNIGPEAGKPVMEGKGVLFKRFADIDVFDLELRTQDAREIIQTVKLLEPTFGGINLEDIKAPECFEIEETLKKEMNIPVFHDDQHGTAIISGAALLNASELIGKPLEKMKVVFSGAGAAGIACAKFYISLGVKKENVIMCDSKGVIYKGRTAGMNKYKEELAADTDARTIEEALVGADAFFGVSVANLLTKEMVQSMGDHPIIFAMANPDPEITYENARAWRDDVIIATGRSDYPNQVNNVLGFPFIFRGALDVHATSINEEMKVAAARALADLAKEPVPFSVMQAYGDTQLKFGLDYLIPKPFDPRVLIWEASAVARAAMETGVARRTIDIEKYKEELEDRLGIGRHITRVFINKAKKAPKRIVYPEGDSPTILKACEIIVAEGMARPVLLGNVEKIRAAMAEMEISHLEKSVTIIDPEQSDKLESYADTYYTLRQRKGVLKTDARHIMQDPVYFGAMMVHADDADGMVSGLTHRYRDTIKPALEIIGVREEASHVAGLHMVIYKDKTYYFADTTININPSAQELADIAILTAREVKRMGVEPRVALLSFSNFGSVKHIVNNKIREAIKIVHEREPNLIIDGEMQASTAVSPAILDEVFPFSKLAGKNGANVLIFPNIESGNIAYKLLEHLGGAETIGPILMGLKKPVHPLQIGDYDEIGVVNMTAIAVMDAQSRK
ncbi:MAG TPA: NADP-dependent malic enzyme [Caldithrix abyssi]|uniref:NADP-dependent malic enzyme n=1 Tax=Caldithrix abyssi TaxID=187145 RepID=A0A7V1LQV5_CALAY|nr:NADP-dependent malic enzyme [Caldithrix abyssi]